MVRHCHPSILGPLRTPKSTNHNKRGRKGLVSIPGRLAVLGQPYAVSVSGWPGTKYERTTQVLTALRVNTGQNPFGRMSTVLPGNDVAKKLCGAERDHNRQVPGSCKACGGTGWGRTLSSTASVHSAATVSNSDRGRNAFVTAAPASQPLPQAWPTCASVSCTKRGDQKPLGSSSALRRALDYYRAGS